MVDMSTTPEEAKEYASGMAASNPGDAPKYPYGLCLCLNDESMKKLGLTEMLPVGTEVTITAKAKVTSVRASEEVDGDKNASMDLQVTDMELSTGQRQADPKAFYSNSNMA
jgi:hypothetical protein